MSPPDPTNRPGLSRHATTAVLAGALVLYTLAGAWIAAQWQHRAGTPLSGAGFGYGPLIEALDRTGRYAVADVHYPGIAFSAHRLPLVPGLLMGLRALVGDDLARIGLGKALLFNALLGAVAGIVAARARPLALRHLALLAVPLAMPFWNLTLFEVSVEEAYLIPLLGLLVAVLWFGLSPTEPRPVAVAAVVLLCASLPWIKHSMLYWTLVTPVVLGFRTRSVKLAVLGFAVVAASLLGLAAFTAHVSGRFTLQSSWEGWNLYKGNNPATKETYPYYSLDVLDYTGKVQADRPLRDEWDHNAYFRNQALTFIRAQPRESLENAARKAWVFFFEIRRTGRSLGQTDDAGPLRLLQSAALLVFRVLFWIAVALAVRATLRTTAPWAERTVPASFLLLIALCAGFHVVGFAYERHVMPLVLPTVLFLVWHGTRTPRAAHA
jgi:hypothetical protein